MGETMVIYGKKGLKRKRGSPSMAELLRKEEKESRISELGEEMEGLFGYFKEVREEEEKEKMGVELIGNRNSAIAVLLEGSSLPLSKLVDEVFNKVKDGGGSVASVRSDVLLIGQRSMYGLRNVDADVLEDDSGSCLWCWETRDIKLIPKSMRGPLKIWRTCRKKIHERITAVHAMINVLQKSDSDQTCGQDLAKASERLSKVLSGSDIRVLISSMVQKNGAELVVKEGIREKNMMIKQMERHKREVEKEKKRLDLEHQKEKLQSEKELRRLQAEAEREEKRCEKEESELRKQLKKQQEEAERDQRRREKEEAEQKKQLALQKQASLMERFLKKSKNSSPSHKEPSKTKSTSTDASCAKAEKKFEPVTLSMDFTLSQYDGIDTNDIWKLHLNSWRSIGHSIRSNRKEHWGIRRIPKMELVKELKLTTTRQFHHEDEFGLEKLDDGWDESGNTHSKCKQYLTNPDVLLPTGQKFKRKKQLLQFDKSHRPAFYGTWPKQSQVIGPRHPFVQDPDLDYDIDSDEEWEEEEPGESLSDCDKDDLEETLEEGLSKVEEDESEDGFFVPDGYLSEDEGVQDSEMDCKNLVTEARSSPSCKQVESEDLSVFFRQQKYLHNATEHALRKNKPLIILNFMNEKLSSTLTGETTGMLDIEQTCLLALSMRVFPGFPSLEISVVEDVEEQNLEASPSSSKGNTIPVSTASAVLDSDLHQIVSVIQSCSSGINKVVESLHLKFPTVPKTQLSKKVREISDFKDNCWQIKKDILNKLGLSPSPEISHAKTKSIVSFFSKRCLPLVGKSQNPSSDTSPQSAQKPESATQLQQNYTQSHL